MPDLTATSCPNATAAADGRCSGTNLVSYLVLDPQRYGTVTVSLPCPTCLQAANYPPLPNEDTEPFRLLAQFMVLLHRVVGALGADDIDARLHHAYDEAATALRTSGVSDRERDIWTHWIRHSYLRAAA